MARTLILGLLLLAAARMATADEMGKGTSAAESAPAAGAPEPIRSVKATKQRAKQTVSAKTGDDKANPPAATSQAQPPGGDVKMSGMSILGNEDAPKSLVLVPWKSSQLADMPTVSRLLDSAAQPVDKDVFMRELAYYEYKSSSK
jgi:hypothetical protein